MPLQFSRPDPPFSGHPGCGGLLQRLSLRTCRCHRDVLLLQPWGGRGCGEWWASMNGGWRVSMCLNPSVASPLAVDLGARGRSRRSPRLRRAQPLPRPRPRAPARRAPRSPRRAESTQRGVQGLKRVTQSLFTLFTFPTRTGEDFSFLHILLEPQPPLPPCGAATHPAGVGAPRDTPGITHRSLAPARV